MYSVHQHAMGPMALHELHEAGGDDHAAAIALGLRWLDTHPEVIDELISERLNVVWRKVGRHEQRKIVRRVAAMTTAGIPGLHLPLIDRVWPPGRIEHGQGGLCHRRAPDSTQYAAWLDRSKLRNG